MPAKIDPASRAVIAELLATDADLHAMARDFLQTGLRDLINLQKRGDPAIRAQLARALAGPIVDAITATPEQDEFGELRTEMEALMTEVRAAISPPTTALTKGGKT